MLEKRDFYINGQWVAPAVANDFPVINPSNEEQCAVISLGGQADTDAAVTAARAAFDGWSQTPHAERVALIKKFSDIYEARKGEMAEAISMEMGAPLELARNQQVGAGTWHTGGFLKAIEDFKFDRDFNASEKTLLEPIGVCALIHTLELANEPDHPQGDPGASNRLHRGAGNLPRFRRSPVYCSLSSCMRLAFPQVCSTW